MILPTLSTRAVALIAGLVAMGVLALVIPSCLQKQRSERAQARVEAAQGSAFQNSASDAVGTLDGTQGNALASEQTGDQHETAIRAAPGNAPLAPSINRAARRGMCDYRANRNKPECVVHQPDPR